MDRRRFLAGLGGIVAAPHLAASQAASVREHAAVRHLQPFIVDAMQRHKTLGVSVALVDAGRIAWTAGFGFADRAQTRKVTAASVFSLQSISKTYTALLFLMAVDRGWFGLDDKLLAHLPSFRVNSRFADDDFGKITLRQLLSHWSGLTHEAPIGNNYDDGNCTFEQHVASISDTWLLAPPGSRYAYSNLGFDLLAYLVEKRSGKPFARFAHEELFAPLAMRASTYDHAQIRPADFVRGQQEGKDVAVFIPMLGAGGVYSTAPDMARFMLAQLSQTRSVAGQRLLDPHTWQEMHTPQYPVDHQVCGYGLGLFSRPAHGATMLSHGGGGYGYDTELRWFPEYGMGAAVLTNDGEGGLAEEIADEAVRAMLKQRFGTVPADKTIRLTDRPAVAADPAEMKSLEGSYRAYSGMRKFALVNGALHYRVGTNDEPLTFHGAGEYTTANERFRFHAGEDAVGARVDDLGSVGVDTFIVNERVDEPPGPGKAEWLAFAGDYEGSVYGAVAQAKIELRNGYLFASRGGGTKLVEYKPGFFFTTWGESVVFENDVMSYGNRRFTKVKVTS